MTETDPIPQVAAGPHFRLDLSRRPALCIERAAPVGGTVALLFGLWFTGLGCVGLWAVVTAPDAFGGERFLVGCVFLFGFAGGGVLCVRGAFRHLLTSKRVLFGEEAVTFQSRRPFRTTHWSESYAAFGGVHLRMETVHLRYGSQSFWVIELVHPDPRRTLLLLRWRAGVDVQVLKQALHRYAARLQVPVTGPPVAKWRRRLLQAVPGETFVERMLHRLGWPVRQLARYADDPWPTAWNPGVKPSALGSGSTRSFDWYLTRESAVAVTTVDDVVDWLVGCVYASDEELFDHPDVWQHPSDFEGLRRGDCEDHALWAWRKFIELGLEARLFVGLYVVQEGQPAILHAWVTYIEHGVEYLVEATTKQRDGMIGTVAEHGGDYCPHFSVGPDLRIRSHRGYVMGLFGWAWSRSDGRPRPSL